MSICNKVDWILRYLATVLRFPKLNAREATLKWYISMP
jgi:hypothetical protein